MSVEGDDKKQKFFYSDDVKRRRRTFKTHQKKRSQNPFENFYPKNRHNFVGGKPKKPVRPSRTTRRAVDKVTEESIRNRNVFVQSKKKGKKRKRVQHNFRQRFNLNDSSIFNTSSSTSSGERTHLGDPDEDFLKRMGVGEMDKFKSTFQPPNKRRKLTLDPNAEKKRIYSDVIRNSKIKRGQRKRNRLRNEEAVDELDKSFKELKKMDRKDSNSNIFTRNNSDVRKDDVNGSTTSIDPLTVPPPPPASSKSDDLTDLIEKLQSEEVKLIRPSLKANVMRSVEDEKRFLQKKEEERIKRMKNPGDEDDEGDDSSIPTYVPQSADALDDDYLKFVEDDEEHGIETEDLELDYDSLETRNVKRMEKEDEDEDEDELSEGEFSHKQKKKKKRKKKRKKKMPGEITNINPYLPLVSNSSTLFRDEDEDDDRKEEENEEDMMSFVPELPTTFKDLKEFVKDKKPSKIHTFFLRIGTVHCARLSPENHSKMSKFYTLLFRYFFQILQKTSKSALIGSGKNDGLLKVLDVLSFHLHLLSFQVPKVTSTLLSKRIALLRSKSQQHHQQPTGHSGPPSWDDLFLVALTKKVYPSTDFTHPIFTPLMETLSSIVGSIHVSKVRSPEYLFLIKLIISILSPTRRYFPAMNHFFHLCFSSIIQEPNNNNNENQQKSGVHEVGFLEYVLGQEEVYHRDWNRRVFLLFSEFLDLYSNLPSLPEILETYRTPINRILRTCDQERKEWIQNVILSKMEKGAQEVGKARVFLTYLRPVAPPQIGMVSPAYQKVGGYRGKIVRNRVQKTALMRRKIKKAIRGVRKVAVKHIQKKETIGNIIRERERKRKDKEMKSKYKRVVTLLQADREKSSTSHVKDKDVERIRQRKKMMKSRRRR